MYSVVLVEDEHWVMTGLVKMFQWAEYGFSVIGKFEYAHEAEEFILQNTPDVIFMDVNLPDFSGLDLAERLRERGRTSKIVIISGYSSFSYAQKAISMEVFDYLLKPVAQKQADDLLSRLRKRLDEENNIGADEKSLKIEEIHNSAFKQLIRYINDNYCERLSLKELSQKFDLNASYCSQLFSRHFDCGFNEYVIQIRMTKAADFLKQGKSVQDAAEMVGYEYVHFNKLFKKYYGVTPYYFKNM